MNSARAPLQRRKATAITEEPVPASRLAIASAKIILADEPCYIGCTIRSISRYGALVTTQIAVALPCNVFLWDASTGLIYDCHVEWRKQSLVGLRFNDFGDRSAQHLAFAKHTLPRAVAPPPVVHPIPSRPAA
jgi:hypothetical protein